jgi:CspA family cold shock protein
MATGTVKWFSDKGYGFIAPDDASNDLFVHHAGVTGERNGALVEGAKVSYDHRTGDRGPKAINVEFI